MYIKDKESDKMISIRKNLVKIINTIFQKKLKINMVSQQNIKLQKVIQRIEANKKGNDGCHSKFVGIPCNGTLYIDTVFEEIAWNILNIPCLS